MSQLKRAISISDLENFSPRLLPFEGQWYDLMGYPELKGTWLIWGDSGSGKTRFSLQLAKYLSQWVRIGYNSLEEGLSESLRIAFHECGMSEVKRRIVLFDQEPISDMVARIKAPKAPKVWIVDSLQYTDMNYFEYKAFRELFNRGRQLILISHATGRLPEGRTANKVRFDAFVKIRVEGYRAFAMSRYGGTSHYDIWPEGAARYWGDSQPKSHNQNPFDHDNPGHDKRSNY